MDGRWRTEECAEHPTTLSGVQGTVRVRGGDLTFLAAHRDTRERLGAETDGPPPYPYWSAQVTVKESGRRFGDTAGCQHQGGCRRRRTDRSGRGFLISSHPLTGVSVCVTQLHQVSTLVIGSALHSGVCASLSAPCIACCC